MKSLDYYSKRIIRAADHAFIDGRDRLPSISQSIYQVVAPGSNSGKRAYALLSLLRQGTPEALWQSSIIQKTFRDFSNFPFNQDKYILKHRIGSGNQCDCYLLEALDKNNESWALKVFQTPGDNLTELENKARQVNADYATLSSWYKEMPGLIPAQSSLIINNFKLPHNKPVFVVLQKFLGSNVKDLAVDFTEADWKALCQRNPEIKEQLKKFVLITRKDIMNYDKVPDLLGHSNLSIVDEANAPQLFFLDPDGIDEFSDMDKRTKTKIEHRLELLDARAGIN
jgi:hypothetical protein